MRIEKIINQSRRDFNAVYVCEHCGYKEQGYGYDDSYFHNVFIPNMKCKKCGKTADDTYRALAPKYESYVEV